MHSCAQLSKLNVCEGHVTFWKVERLSYLDSDFWQVDFHGELLARVDVRVVRLLEGPLQLVQLVRREGRPVTPVLLARPARSTTADAAFAVAVLTRKEMRG